MKSKKLILRFLIVSLLFFNAGNLLAMQPAPAVQPVTLTQEAKVFLSGFMLGPAMLLVENLESNSLVVMGLERIPFMGVFVRLLPLSLIVMASFHAGGLDMPNDPSNLSKRACLIALAGFMLGWAVAESILVTGGKVTLEAFLQELLNNFGNLVWRFDAISTIESQLPRSIRLILKYMKYRSS